MLFASEQSTCTTRSPVLRVSAATEAPCALLLVQHSWRQKWFVFCHPAADVLTIENSRSGDEMIRALANFGYSRDLGPGVYDVHRCSFVHLLHLVVCRICWVCTAHKQHGCASVSSISGSYAGQEHPVSDAQTQSCSTLNLDDFSAFLHLLVL